MVHLREREVNAIVSIHTSGDGIKFSRGVQACHEAWYQAIFAFRQQPLQSVFCCGLTNKRLDSFL
jgi:hypothetical protein